MSFSLVHRFIVQPETLDFVRSHCERTEDFVWVGAKGAARPQRLRRHTLRGVPARRIDLALLDEWDGESLMAVEIGQKSGRFDGATRTQIVVRHWYSRTAGQMPPLGWLRINREEDDAHIVLSATWADGGEWIECHRFLRSDLTGYDMERLVLWHWTRYYRFISREDAESAAMAFESLHPAIREGTLAEANRAASRYLYDIARQLGWCKLTAREQVKRGVSGQWHRTEEVYGTAQGVGEYTLDAANGRRPMREPRELSREEYLDSIAESLDAE